MSFYHDAMTVGATEGRNGWCSHSDRRCDRGAKWEMCGNINLCAETEKLRFEVVFLSAEDMSSKDLVFFYEFPNENSIVYEIETIMNMVH